MLVTLIIVLAVFVVIALYSVTLYNHLVRLKHNVAKAWSNIDVVLKQRHDELPKLVAVCQHYMDYERETLERVVRARSAVFDASQRGDARELGAAEIELRGGLDRLLALAENYPDLKADESFRQLSERISQLEDSIADRRELYNESVNLNNVRIEQFPDVLIARMFAFGTAELLEFSAERADVDVRALFQ